MENEPKTKPFVVRLTTEELEALKRWAAAERHPLATLGRYILSDAIKTHEANRPSVFGAGVSS